MYQCLDCLGDNTECRSRTIIVPLLINVSLLADMFINIYTFEFMALFLPSCFHIVSDCENLTIIVGIVITTQPNYVGCVGSSQITAEVNQCQSQLQW